MLTYLYLKAKKNHVLGYFGVVVQVGDRQIGQVV